MQSNVFWSSDAEGRRNTAADSETDLQGDFLNCSSVQYRNEKMPGSQPELLFHKILPLVLNKGWLISIFFISVLNKGGTGKKSPSISPISHWFLFRANASETDLFYLSSVTLFSPHCCWKWSRDRFVFLSSVTPGRSNKPRMQPHNWHEMIVRML